MAKIGISEFTFGFAFLREQLNLQQITGYPVLPSLSGEAQLGWDAAITPANGTVVFYQFKMSEYLAHFNGKHIADGMYQQYYRFHLHKAASNRQHRLLKELADTLAPTYYVAPEIATEALFSEAYQNGTVITSTRLIPLIDCPVLAANDSQDHYITYTPANTGFNFHSEPRPSEHSVRGNELEVHYRALLTQRRKITDEYVSMMFAKATSILKSSGTEDTEIVPERINERPLGSLAEFMATNFGLTTVVIAERTSP